MTYDLTVKAHLSGRSGMKRQNIYGSLHEGTLKLKKEVRTASPEDYNALPADDSLDEATVADESPRERSSDCGSSGSRSVKAPARFRIPWKKERTKFRNEEDEDSAHEDGLAPSNTPSTTFVSQRNWGSRNESQSNQKRIRTDVVADDDDDDEFGMAWSQRSSKETYTKNLLKKPTKEQRRPVKAASQDSLKGKPAFKKPKFEFPSAQGRKSSGAFGEPLFKRPPSNETTPRSRRASQRSSQDARETPQGTPKKEFKQPKRLSPKKATPTRQRESLNFKGPTVFDRVDTQRTTRFSASTRDSSKITDTDGLTILNLQSKASASADKLRMSDLQPKIPPSSMTTPSEPSLSFDLATTLSSPLTSVHEDYDVHCASDGIGENAISEDITLPPKEKPSICPFCKGPVDKDFLEERISVKGRPSIRQQAQFCKSHKSHAAEEEWKELQYPSIDWPNLESHLNQFHAALDDILQRRCFSFYRNALEDVVQSRKNKTLRQDVLTASRIEELSPGYYGSRGARIMYVTQSPDSEHTWCTELIVDRTENIMANFNSKLRRLSASDDLISSGGVSEFVQAVLVPELALLLVKNDMNIEDDEKAREVLRNSVDIGHLLNEEEDEVIEGPEPDETRPMELI